MNKEPLPQHLGQLTDNLEEVLLLQDIHHFVTPAGRGRKYNVGVLHKSSIVLLVACWEAYIEDLCQSSLQEMLFNAKDHTIFPQDVLTSIASKCQGEKAWSLAGPGWRKVMTDNQKEVFAKTIGTLNTPKSKQINDLFKKTIGLIDLSSKWKWRGKTPEQACKDLDDLVTLRGSIAHRVKSSQSVTKTSVSKATSLIGNLAAESHNAVNDFLEIQLGFAPWTNIQVHREFKQAVFSREKPDSEIEFIYDPETE